GGTSLPIRNLGPDLGEHTEQVLGGLLGMTDAQIAQASAGERNIA
ncbi:MAG: CoA transferase, partial [Glutamicibacter sp.]